MEFTGNIDNSEVREIVQDEIDNIDLDSRIDDRTDDILSGKDLLDSDDVRIICESIHDMQNYATGDEVTRLVGAHKSLDVLHLREFIDLRLDEIDERIAQAVVIAHDFDMLVHRIKVLEDALAAAQKFVCAMLIGPKVDDSDIVKSDAPEA